MPHKPFTFPGVRFSVAGLDRTKISFSQLFESLLFVVVKVISILLKQTLSIHS